MTRADEIRGIVARFGGPSLLGRRLAEYLGRPKPISQSSVSMWGTLEKIPDKWHLPLLRLAEIEGIELSEDELSTTSRGKDINISGNSTPSPPARDNADA